MLWFAHAGMHLAQHRLGKITVVRNASRGGQREGVWKSQERPERSVPRLSFGSVADSLRNGVGQVQQRRCVEVGVGFGVFSRVEHRRRDQRAALYFVPSRQLKVCTRPQRVRPARAVANDVDVAFSRRQAPPQERREHLQLELWRVGIASESGQSPG